MIADKQINIEKKLNIIHMDFNKIIETKEICSKKQLDALHCRL